MSPRWTIRSLSLCAAASLVAAAAFLGVAAADQPLAATVQSKLTASDAQPGARFGNTVAISGDTAIVGTSVMSNSQPPGGPLPNRVHVFARHGSTWSEEAQLDSVMNPPVGGFGSSIAIDGDTAVVADSASAPAYVFVRSAGAWSQQGWLDPADPETGGTNEVAVSGDTAVIMTANLAVYVFRRAGDSWTSEGKLVPESVVYPRHIAVSGDSVAVSNVPGMGDTSSVHVFGRHNGTWIDDATLSLTLFTEQIEGRVSFSGDTLVVGGNPRSHVFTRKNGVWAEQAVLGPAGNGLLGAAALSGDTIAISETAYRHDDGAGVFSPVVAVYRPAGDGWALETEVGIGIDQDAPTQPGPIAISGETVVLGVTEEKPDHGGSAYAIVIGAAPASAGCACRVGEGAPPAAPLVTAAIIGLAIAGRRRRRA